MQIYPGEDMYYLEMMSRLLTSSVNFFFFLAKRNLVSILLFDPTTYLHSKVDDLYGLPDYKQDQNLSGVIRHYDTFLAILLHSAIFCNDICFYSQMSVFLYVKFKIYYELNFGM